MLYCMRFDKLELNLFHRSKAVSYIPPNIFIRT